MSVAIINRYRLQKMYTANMHKKKRTKIQGKFLPYRRTVAFHEWLTSTLQQQRQGAVAMAPAANEQAQHYGSTTKVVTKLQNYSGAAFRRVKRSIFQYQELK